jgi:hypothetical protein
MDTGSEWWAMRTKGKTRITASEVKLLRRTGKYTWKNENRNEDTLK